MTVKIILATAATMFVLHRYNKEQEEKQEQERKKNELAALSQTDTKGGNYVHLAEKLRGQLRHNALNVVDSIDHRIQTVTDTSDSRSCPSPQSKQAGYQRSAVRPEPGTARASPGNTHHPEMTVVSGSQVLGERIPSDLHRAGLDVLRAV